MFRSGERLGGKMTVNILKSGSDPYVNSRNRFAFPYSSSLIMDVQIWRKAWGEDDSEYLEIRERPLCELEESLCVSLLKQFDHGCSDLEKGLGGEDSEYLEIRERHLCELEE